MNSKLGLLFPQTLIMQRDSWRSGAVAKPPQEGLGEAPAPGERKRLQRFPAARFAEDLQKIAPHSLLANRDVRDRADR